MRTAGTLLSFALCLGTAGTAFAQAPAAEPARGNVSFGASATPAAASAAGSARGAETPGAAAELGAEAAQEREWAERESKLNDAATLYGGVGLIHTQHAQGGAAGQFRIGFTTEYFSAGFLCSRQFPCRDPSNAANVITTDSADHIGGRLSLSMDLASWLETYLSTSAVANSNPANRPSLLQVLGDSVLGGKAHVGLSDVFHIGGAFELWLLNGTGSVGLDGGGTSAKFRGLATADLRAAESKLPLRFSLNTTYVLDNSGEVVQRTEAARSEPISRIERYGLNINRVDHFDVHFGGEVFLAEEKVRPFLEYHLLVPVNRQGYRCRPANPSSDKCLATDGFAPSSLTVGGRFYPWKHGFNLTAALDIGVTGVGFFIEEMRPTPPWMLYLGAGWAFDTQDRPPVVRERVVSSPTRGGGRKIRGFVHEEGQSTGIASAIVAWENHPELTSLATGTDGSFTTHELPPGPYTFTVNAEGFKPGQCSTAVGTSAPVQQGPNTPPPSGGDIQLDCPLVAQPRVGSIVGKIKDADTNGAIGNAAIRIVDGAKKELTGSADSLGSFRFELVSPGDAQITVDADGYLAAVEKLDVKTQKENAIEVALKRKPKNSLVTVQNKEIVIRQQVQFAVDSATILPASTGLLTEIADSLVRTPRIKRVEVQGHTDGSGSPTHNMKLSEDRAAAVVGWLTAHGVAAERLTAKGYGDTRPLVPNVTELNKQRNRRVQFIIVEQEPAAPAAKPAAPAGPATTPQPRF